MQILLYSVDMTTVLRYANDIFIEIILRNKMVFIQTFKVTYIVVLPKNIPINLSTKINKQQLRFLFHPFH